MPSEQFFVTGQSLLSHEHSRSSFWGDSPLCTCNFEQLGASVIDMSVVYYWNINLTRSSNFVSLGLNEYYSFVEYLGDQIIKKCVLQFPVSISPSSQLLPFSFLPVSIPSWSSSSLPLHTVSDCGHGEREIERDCSPEIGQWECEIQTIRFNWDLSYSLLYYIHKQDLVTDFKSRVDLCFMIAR